MICTAAPLKLFCECLHLNNQLAHFYDSSQHSHHLSGVRKIDKDMFAFIFRVKINFSLQGAKHQPRYKQAVCISLQISSLGLSQYV